MSDWIKITLAALCLLFAGGCTRFEVVKPDGTRISGGSFMTDKGIEHAKIDGLGEIQGYTSEASAAMRAAIELLSAARSAARP